MLTSAMARIVSRVSPSNGRWPRRAPSRFRSAATTWRLPRAVVRDSAAFSSSTERRWTGFFTRCRDRSWPGCTLRVDRRRAGCPSPWSPPPPPQRALRRLRRSPAYSRDQVPITISNVSFDGWGKVFGDDVIASAILDLLPHQSHIFALNRPSYRLKDMLAAAAKPAEEG
ncbi:MAG: hypothetical protein GEU73_11250 [Chloroflexi bacterium]|nr:hypothetical protein [Chloroflexota bacterium]